MKSNLNSPGKFGGLIQLPATEVENEFTDAYWLAMRAELMDISSNPIFPRKEQSLFRLQPVRKFLFSAFKVLVKI